MSNMPIVVVVEDPLSTDAEPASHPSYAWARSGRLGLGTADRAC
jgi:hypothetical protein